MGVNYYPFHIGDFVRDTRHLSLLEDGVYRRLLDLYYTQERPFDQPVDKLCVLIGAKASAERQAVDVVIRSFFVRGDDGLIHHKRCDVEIAKAKEKSKKASSSAGKRWQSDGNANAMRTHSEGNANQYPRTNNQENQRGGDRSPEQPKPGWWETQEATLEAAKSLGLNTLGETWISLKSAVRDELAKRPQRRQKAA